MQFYAFDVCIVFHAGHNSAFGTHGLYLGAGRPAACCSMDASVASYRAESLAKMAVGAFECAFGPSPYRHGKCRSRHVLYILSSPQIHHDLACVGLFRGPRRRTGSWAMADTSVISGWVARCCFGYRVIRGVIPSFVVSF